MARARRYLLDTRAPALMEYCEQMRFRALNRARLLAEQTARRDAEHVAQIKSDFISMMSHELRTPLNSIIGFSELLAQPSTYLKDSERINYAELIYNSGRHLTSVVNSILEMSKIQSGTYEVELADKNLVEILRDVMAALEVLAHKKGVMLARKWGAESVIARIDETRFVQSVSNIIDNAIKFTDGGGTVTVECGHGEDGTAVVTVSDTGIGMDEAGLARAMTPFGQAGRGLDRDAEGTGLGLCIAKELTELQQGRFSIRSTPGEGTVIQFRMPTPDGAVAADETHPAPDAGEAGERAPVARSIRKAAPAHVGQ